MLNVDIKKFYIFYIIWYFDWVDVFLEVLCIIGYVISEYLSFLMIIKFVFIVFWLKLMEVYLLKILFEL